jgi:integrase
MPKKPKPKTKLDKKFFATVKPPAEGREIHWDTKQKGFGLLVTAKGHKSFVVQYQVGSGRKARTLRRMRVEAETVEEARTLAEAIHGKVSTGRALGQRIDPLEQRRHDERVKSGEGTFRAITADWYARAGKRNRSGARRFAEIKRLAFPMLGDRQINDIKPKNIQRLLDEVQDTNGIGMADYILSAVRRVMSWYESRGEDENFVSPVRRGMARTSTSKQARRRILTDDELRAVWSAAETSPGPYGAFLQVLLLTATRREEAAKMRRSELSGGTWIIPAERYKTGIEHVIPLSTTALAITDRLPRLGNGDLVFTVSGRFPISSFVHRKAAFDKACGVTGWVLHDLRRTARSLMSRAGTNADIAERCLGHVISGVRGTYDRYAYLEEKRHAFEALAALVERIVNPPANNVTSLDERRARGVSQVPG